MDIRVERATGIEFSPSESQLNLTAYFNSPLRSEIYVVNEGSDSVSVISGENYTKIGEDIPVGVNPTAIAVNDATDAMYVINEGSNSISVIDGIANKVVAGVVFNVNPPNSGSILCDGLSSPTPPGNYIYLYSGDQCVARPNSGSEFVSWQENLNDNSAGLVNPSADATSLDTIASILGKKLDEPEAKITVTKFGTFTANFRALPPSIPMEYQTMFIAALLAGITAILVQKYVRKNQK
jgi:YVTN family beta-propeller protein